GGGGRGRAAGPQGQRAERSGAGDGGPRRGAGRGHRPGRAAPVRARRRPRPQEAAPGAVITTAPTWLGSGLSQPTEPRSSGSGGIRGVTDDCRSGAIPLLGIQDSVRGLRRAGLLRAPGHRRTPSPTRGRAQQSANAGAVEGLPELTRRLVPPRVRDQLVQLAGVYRREPDEHRGKALVVRLREELVLVRAEEDVLLDLVADADREDGGVRDARLLRMDALRPDPGEPFLLAPAQDREGEAALGLARLRQRQSDAPDVVRGCHLPTLQPRAPRTDLRSAAALQGTDHVIDFTQDFLASVPAFLALSHPHASMVTCRASMAGHPASKTPSPC